MESKIGLIVQFVGVLLVTVLSFFLRRSLASPAASYWSVGWAFLTLALASLSFAFLYEKYAAPLFAVYFFGEYVFGLMLYYGSRALMDEGEPSSRRPLVLIPFAILAVALSVLGRDFGLIFNLHAFVLGTFFAVTFHLLGKTRHHGFGWRTMRVAVALLALDFYHYFVVFALELMGIRFSLSSDLVLYNPVVDLVFEVMLGFGMVIILLEQVLDQVNAVNAKLKDAHAKLESLALVDPLTTALNRHAFYGYVHRSGAENTELSGCVGFFDIDDLKPINDQLGHGVGDMAIRAVVGAIRDIVRAEDLIYRWGGDEFFALLVSMDAEMARERMATLERKLTDIHVEGADKPLTIRVSCGFADFANAGELDAAIKKADEIMYAEKQRRKDRRQKAAQPPIYLSNDNIRVSREV